MRARAGVSLRIAATLAALAAAPLAAADVSTTTDVTSTVPPVQATTTTETATTTETGTTETATTAADTAPTETQPAPTDTATETTTAAETTAAAATAAAAHSLDRGCLLGGVALLLPLRAPLVLGPLAQAPATQRAALSRLVYPADGSVVSADGVSLEASACTGGRAQVRSLALFSGTVTARLVLLRVGGGVQQTTVAALRVDGRVVAANAGRRVPLGSWGYLVADSRQVVNAGTRGRLRAGGLAVHLVRAHAGLPAGTVLLVSFAGLPSRAAPAQKRSSVSRKRHRKKATHLPLKVTPSLVLKHYVFPVAGPSGYGDTYGADRSDVPGGWHHGDDIFAPLGTPVVAVASGTVNRVGWKKLGGWRLWVRDSVGNEFYYAHLSGYAPAVLRDQHVRAGQVVGFVGNTGDAYTTPPHLHFEVHPRPLLHLHYDGAVDPTTYLNGWTHVERRLAPLPAHPRLPTRPAFRREARKVFRELLVARHVVGKVAAAKRKRRLIAGISVLHRIARRGPQFATASAPVTAAPPRSPDRGQATLVAALAGTGSLGLFGLSLLALPRLRRRRTSR